MFENFLPGPLVMLTKLSALNEASDAVLDDGFIVVAIIKDKTHPLFRTFDNQKPKAQAVLITVQYKENYE